VYRRAALDSTGGSTLIEHSEDVHTGFDLRRKGWTRKYLPIPLATGLCPGDVNSFFTQQYRWCAGSMSLLGSTKFWNTRMPLRTRLSYLSGFCYYVHTAVFTLAGPICSRMGTTLRIVPPLSRMSSTSSRWRPRTSPSCWPMTWAPCERRLLPG